MNIEQKIYSKLEPHAQRINAGDGNDFDYLPAVLLHLIETQKQQAKLLDDSAKVLVANKSVTETFAAETKEGVAMLRDSQLVIDAQLKALANEYVTRNKQTAESLSTTRSHIESLASRSQQMYLKLMRLLIVGLIASVGTIGLVIAIFQRH